MAPYSGDKHMDPFTQLKVLYKRKGIPLTPLGWIVVLIFLVFVIWEIYSLAHRRPQVFINADSNSIRDGLGKEALSRDEVQKRRDKIVTANRREKLVNELGESGLAGGHVIGNLKERTEKKVEVEEGMKELNDNSKETNELGETAKKLRTDEKSVKSLQKEEKEEKEEKKTLNEEPPDARPIVKDPRQRRARPTMDPKEFGGEIIELKRPDIPDDEEPMNENHDEILPDIKPFVRDDKLVPAAHLEHIPKPKPRGYQVDLVRQPVFETCEQYRTIIIVHSEAQNSELRSGIRATWYDSKNYERFANLTNLWKVIFIVGKTYDEYDEHIQLEAKEHNDLIQAEFLESAYEDTRKFIIATRFLVDNFKNCPPKFVLKTKDNIFLNMISIQGWLTAKFKTARRLYVGNFLKGDQPIRDWTHPLYVSREEYGKTFFPNMLSGPVYLFSYDVIEMMTTLYAVKRPIAMEDGYIGILMESLKVKPRHNEHFWLLGMHGNKCNYLRMFFVQNVKPLDHLRLMASNKEARKSKECLNAKHYDFKSGKELDDENPA